MRAVRRAKWNGPCEDGANRAAAGFSLLEVILALAILAGAIAVLGEVSGIGMRNARLARDLTCAQLLCESKMAEIASGLESAEAQQDVPLGTVSDPAEADWLYSVEVNSTTEDGLTEVRVTVYKDLPAEKHPPQFTLVRWIAESAGETSADETSEEEGMSTESGTGTSTSGGDQ